MTKGGAKKKQGAKERAPSQADKAALEATRASLNAQLSAIGGGGSSNMVSAIK